MNLIARIKYDEKWKKYYIFVDKKQVDPFYYHNDIRSIKFLQIDKNFFIDKMIQYGAKNEATREFPSLFFVTTNQAQIALDQFVKPMLVAANLIGGF